MPKVNKQDKASGAIPNAEAVKKTKKSASAQAEPSPTVETVTAPKSKKTVAGAAKTSKKAAPAPQPNLELPAADKPQKRRPASKSQVSKPEVAASSALREAEPAPHPETALATEAVNLEGLSASEKNAALSTTALEQETQQPAEPVEQPAPARTPAMQNKPRTSQAKTAAETGTLANATKPKKAVGKPRSQKLTIGESLPASPMVSAAEPVLLEIPEKPQKSGKRQKKVPPASLPDLLEGVEAVPVEQSKPAEAVAPASIEPFQDSPQPAGTLGRKTPNSGKSSRKKEKVTPQSAPTLSAQASRTEDVPNEAVSVAPSDTAPSAAQAAEIPAEEAAPEDSNETNPEKVLLLGQLRKLGRPVHVRDLEKTFTRQALERLGGWRNLAELLEDLVETGQVIRTRKKTYGLPEAMSLVRGRFQASAAGFGFVIPDSGGDDYYVPADKTMEAWNGDIVLVRMEGRGDSRSEGRGDGRHAARRGQKGDGNPRASVVRIVQRAYKQLVGTLEFSHGHPILKPDDHRARHRILLLPEGLAELEAGARVVSELYWPENTGEDEVFGQVSRVLGAEDDPATETEAVIVKYGLRGDFPDEVVEQAEKTPTEIPAEALQGRLDLREFNIFTVDGRDAKDFDDAIHIQPTPEGTFVVGVHIADVSHYVHEGTPLDTEAYARATSVYLPGRVLPMLPEHLSNGVCSLVPYQDRLTMTALVELSAEGDILKVQLMPSVINSKARLTYDEVQAYSEATATLPEHARQLEGDLHLLLKITSKLRQKRLREGSLDFKLREVKVDVGPDGRMELIPIREETARGMIEDLMLLANKVVAHYLLEREIPTLFRIHEEPTLQRFQEVTGAIGRLGFAFPGNEPTPQAYQAVLKQVRGTGRETVVNTLLLRSMQQAKYAGENLGHFGLAFDEYLHFTSPIRRYPDLVVHRTLKAVLSGEYKAGNRAVAQFQASLPGLGDHTSDRERKAAEAERDLTKYYQCKWAQEHLGESFAANVSGVTASGLYIALDNGVEGKLHISHLDDDYYVFIEDAQMLRGRRGGKSFRLGDSVSVTISAVKPLARQIDLVLADPSSPDYKLGSTAPSQENTTMDQTVKPRARRRDEREAEHREKLAAIPVSSPKKFTLDDDAAAIQSSPAPAPRTGGYTRSARSGPRQNSRTENGRGERSAEGRQSGPTFGGANGGGRNAANDRYDSAGGRGSYAHSYSSAGPRRVITLERPRNEHLRPVNITVQRMYFGDWTVENMPPEEGPTQARGGRERGFNRSERGERGSSRNWTRGGADRGAVQNVNGRPQGARSGQAQSAAQPQVQAQAAPAAHQHSSAALATSNSASTSADEAKRRRRRRGRRPGGSAAGGTES